MHLSADRFPTTPEVQLLKQIMIITFLECDVAKLWSIVPSKAYNNHIKNPTANVVMQSE